MMFGLVERGVVAAVHRIGDMTANRPHVGPSAKRSISSSVPPVGDGAGNYLSWDSSRRTPRGRVLNTTFSKGLAP
jgi:hypothetical protein